MSMGSFSVEQAVQWCEEGTWSLNARSISDEQRTDWNAAFWNGGLFQWQPARITQ